MNTFSSMTLDHFQNLARLYVVGGLDEQETVAFEEARTELGGEAELYLQECRRLASALTLSLQPRAPRADARQQLLSRIRASEKPIRRWFH